MFPGRTCLVRSATVCSTECSECSQSAMPASSSNPSSAPTGPEGPQAWSWGPAPPREPGPRGGFRLIARHLLTRGALHGAPRDRRSPQQGPADLCLAGRDRAAPPWVDPDERGSGLLLPAPAVVDPVDGPGHDDLRLRGDRRRGFAVELRAV